MNETKLLDRRTIVRRARALATRIGRTDFRLPSEPMHDGSTHLEIGDAYYLVVTERGKELERRRTTDVDELLYWLMEQLTSSLAWEYELANRRKGEDPRRQGFARQVDLLATLSPTWAERRKREQAAILQRYPLRDR